MSKDKYSVSIHQPDFIPYFGFFSKISKSDTFVIMDNVQLSKSGWTHRDQIKTRKGVEWITIPIIKIKEKQLIKDIKIDEKNNWRKKHLNLIYENYKNSEYFGECFSIINSIYNNETNNLLDFNLFAIKLLFSKLDIKPKIVLLSELNVIGTKSQLLVNILKKLNIKNYISGIGAKNFIDLNEFKKNGLEVNYNDFQHPVYKQLFGNFICNLSIIDLLLNCGISNTKKYIHNE